jgi:hypothetical protein
VTGPELIEVLDRADRERPLTFQSDYFEMFCVIGAVQLACRHPEYKGPVRTVAEDFIRQIASHFPAEVQPLIEKGWNPNHDTISIAS